MLTPERTDMSTRPHPLATALEAAAAGRFPPVDGGVSFVPELADGIQAVVSFTGHSVIATGIPSADLTALGADGFGGATAPEVLLRLADFTGSIGTTDALLVATGRGRREGALQESSEAIDHPRVRHAQAIRRDVRVYGDERGVVTIGRGIAGMREMSIEVAETETSRGWGRALAAAALDTVPTGRPLFAAVTPGNARSLRSFLAAGFTPIGSVTLVTPGRGAMNAGIGQLTGYAEPVSLSAALVAQPTLRTPRLTLVQLGPEFVDEALAALGDAEAMRLTGTRATFTRDQVLAHLSRLPGADDRADFAILDEDGGYVGEVVLNELDDDNFAMNYRIALAGPAVRGKGYGTEAGRAVVEWGFDSVGLHRIGLDVFSSNPGAQRSYEKIGFRVEGRARHTMLWDGEWIDSILMGMLATDPRP